MRKQDRDCIGIGVTFAIMLFTFLAWISWNFEEPTHGLEYPATWHTLYSKTKAMCYKTDDELTDLACEMNNSICESVDLDLIQEDCKR